MHNFIKISIFYRFEMICCRVVLHPPQICRQEIALGAADFVQLEAFFVGFAVVCHVLKAGRRVVTKVAK